MDGRVRPGLVWRAMELFTQLFGDLLAFVYHCFDRSVIYGDLSGLSRPEQVVHFFRQIVGVPAVNKEILSHRIADYQILAHQRSRFTHYYFYLRDETLGPMVM